MRRISRRLAGRLTGLGAIAVAAGLIISGCTATEPEPSSSSEGNAIDMDAALQEGELVVWHNDQEADMVSFLAKFTEKTGIPATQLKIAPAEAMAKLRLEQQAGVSDVDVFQSSPDIHAQLVEQDALLKYEVPNLDEFRDDYKSADPGYWTAYFLNVTPMMYIPGMIEESDLPESYEDLLDPQWKDRLSFPGPTSGTGYNWWFLLKDELGEDYFDKLGDQDPIMFQSSTQGLDDLANGNRSIAGSMSIFQYAKAERRGEQLGFIVDDKFGIPTSLNTVGIISTTKRPNAAKAYEEFLLSEEGQEIWNNEMQGSYSPLPSVVTPELPPLEDLKLLVVTDFDAYTDPENRAKFEELWSRVVGLT
jgi:iron(III) transport system substrate-binding protein